MSPRRLHTKLEQSPRFPVLDSLRAVGAVAVLTTHVAFQSGAYVRHGVVGALLSRLDAGVAVFFVLSGFLLARPYLAGAAAGRRRPATGRYYWKRLIRIYPVYLVTVVLALTLMPGNDAGSVLEWLRTLTLTNVFVTGKLPQGLTQMWSLSVEATFYLVLPALMLAMLGRTPGLRPRRVVVLLIVGVAVSCVWNGSLAGRVDPVTPGLPLLWLPAHLTWFLVGIGLALAHVLHQAKPRTRGIGQLVALGSMPGVCWSVSAGLLLIAATPVGGPILLLVATPTQSVLKHLLYAFVAGLVVVTGVFPVPGSRYARVLSTPFLRHLGHISYSTFCIHLLVLQLVRSLTGHELFSGDGLLLWVLTLGLSLVASELLYRFVEKPAMRLKDLRSGSTRRVGQAKSPPRTRTTRY